MISNKNIGGMLRMASGVEIHTPTEDIAEMPWMVLLSWYLTVMMYMESAAVVAVVATTVVVL